MFSAILFALNIINIGFLAKGDGKPSTMKWALYLTNCIKTVASTILLIEIIFLAVVGEFKQTNNKNSMDYWMYSKYPKFYSKLEYIGFRMQREAHFSEKEW
jgi:hypothetical protein